MAKRDLHEPEKGIHRAKLWEIALFALNNSSTNMTFIMFAGISFFLNGIAGVSLAIIGYVLTAVRMWDAVTDPFIGYIVDKTNGRFGKNRPFIFVGNLIQAGASALIFFVIPMVGENPELGEMNVLRFLLYIVFYMIYIVGYTFQTVVTKSAQTCLTNCPDQRPIFASFDIIYGVIVLSMIPLYSVNYLGDKYGDGVITKAFLNPDYFKELWFFVAGVSFILAILAIIGIWRKDNNNYFGTGKPIKVGFKDYWDTIKNNRAIQMLILSASSDKLTGTIQTNQLVTVMLFGIVLGDFSQSATGNAILAIPQAIISALVVFFIASKLGQKRALVISSLGGIIMAGVMTLLFVSFIPSGGLAEGEVLLSFNIFGKAEDGSMIFNGITTFTILYSLGMIIFNTFRSMAAGMVITMNADCADYEVYRSGKYIPGLMGTLFSFVDKVISSFATSIVAVLVTMIGYGAIAPQQDDPFRTSILVLSLVLFFGFPAFGWLCNLIAMKFYPLNKEKMAEIQQRIGEIKRAYQNEQ